MEYFIFIIILSSCTFIFSLHKPLLLNTDYKAKDIQAYWIYLLIIYFVALALGLRGNMDEYSLFYILVPTLSDFLNNFQLYGDVERFAKNANTANIISYEKGFFFTIIISTIKSLNLSSQFILIFFSSTSVLIHGYFFKKFTPYAFIALLFYLSHEVVGKEWISIRQGLISALVLPSIYFIVNRKRLKFYTLLIFGTLIQYLNIISIFLIFLNKRFDYRLIISLFFIAFIIHSTDFVRTILLNEYFVRNIPNFIYIYLIDDIHGKSISLIQLKFIQQVLFIFFLLFNYKIFIKLSNDLKYFNILFNTYVLGTLLMILFSSFSIFAYRFNGHFYCVEPILISYLMWYFKPNYIALILIIFVCIIFAFTNYVYLEKITPYEFLIKINSLYLIK